MASESVPLPPDADLQAASLTIDLTICALEDAGHDMTRLRQAYDALEAARATAALRRLALERLERLEAGENG